ncbi:MAG TPA: histidine kinase [Dehalococcoidia bacterium]|nr:histidine kinase [Dehalococcoidia bacterium]
MTSERVKELEEQIADLKHRWPPHSVPPQMLERLDELEEALREAKKAEGQGQLR